MSFHECAPVMEDQTGEESGDQYLADFAALRRQSFVFYLPRISRHFFMYLPSGVSLLCCLARSSRHFDSTDVFRLFTLGILYRKHVYLATATGYR